MNKRDARVLAARLAVGVIVVVFVWAAVSVYHGATAPKGSGGLLGFAINSQVVVHDLGDTSAGPHVPDLKVSPWYRQKLADEEATASRGQTGTTADQFPTAPYTIQDQMPGVAPCLGYVDEKHPPKPFAFAAHTDSNPISGDACSMVIRNVTVFWPADHGVCYTADAPHAVE
jgi:hypothetical protein